MATANLLDIAALNGNDKVVGLIEENLSYAPEVGLFPARTIKGLNFTTVTRTGFPSVGFRAANEGSTPSKSSFVKKLVECFLFSGVVQADKAVAQAYEDGADAWEMIEASGVMKQAIINIGKQIWYGVSTDAKGFPGIKSLIAKTDTTALDATGTTATTASSVYGVKFGVQEVQLLLGNGASFELSEFRDQQVTADSGSTWYPARVADMTAWTGLQVGNVNCVGRICNLTADSGKGLTDAKIAQWLSQFPVGYTPDRMFMSRRSAYQLQASRTVTLMGGGAGKVSGSAEIVAPTPTEAFGIPITVTDSILNTDAIE